MNGKDIIKLAADLAAGGITANAIRDHYGEGVLSAVLAISGGAIAGIAVNKALDVLDDHTGIVSDLGSVVDDVVDTFKFW
jgi:outer membrane lipoprotein SlyB